jgi:hypothetical protein
MIQGTQPGTSAEGPAPRDPQDRAKPRRWWPVLTPLVVLLIAVSLLFPSGRHQWAVSVFRQPTDYTILSFSNPTTLPTTAHGGKTIKFDFGVVNREGRSIGYRYVLSVIRHGHSYVLGKSTRMLAAGATWTIAATVRPACGRLPCRIEVSLPGYPETIYFNLNSQVSKEDKS